MAKFKDKKGYTFVAEEGSVLYAILEADDKYEEVKEVKKNAKNRDVKKPQNEAGNKK